MSEKRPGWLSRLILFVLILEVGFPYPMRALASPDRPPPRFFPLPLPLPVPAAAGTFGGEVQRAVVPPWLEYLAEKPLIPLTIGLSHDDRALDEDPWFLRAQRWETAKRLDDNDNDDDPSAVTFSFDRTSFSVRRARSPKAVRVDVPLRPLVFDERYVFLAANDEALFERGRDGDLHGQGIFLLRWQELLDAESAGTRAPIYFFPLPGSAWTGGRVHAVPFPLQSRTVLADGYGNTMSLTDEDVDTVVWAARLNVLLARGAALRSAGFRKESIDCADPLPMPRSTAGFGLLFTGFDVRSPELSLVEGLPRRTGWLQKAGALLAELLPMPREAHAVDGLDPGTKLMMNMVHVGATLSLVIVSSVFFNNTLLKAQLDAQRTAEETEAGRREGWVEGELRSGRELLTTTAATLTTMRQIPTVWPANAVEYTIDRHLPQLGASENSWIRILLGSTLYYSRSVNERLPVDWKTLLLGTFALGLTDSAWLGYQLYYFCPMLMHGLAAGIPELQGRVQATFDLSNPQTEAYVRNDWISYQAYYLGNGATALSSELRTQLVTIEGPHIEQQVRGERKLAPHSEEFKAECERRLNARIDEVFRFMSYPGWQDYRYDAGLLWDKGMRLLGYPAAPANAPEIHVGEKRNGLLVSTVSLALKQARADLAEHPDDPHLPAVVKLYEQLWYDVDYIRSWVAEPAKHLALDILSLMGGRPPPEKLKLAGSIRRNREELLALTYLGPLGVGVRVDKEPTSWMKAIGRDATRVAAHYYRRAFFSRLSGERRILTGRVERERAALGPALLAELERDAMAALKEAHPKEFLATVGLAAEDVPGAEAELRAAHATEYRLILEERILVRYEQEKEAATPYRPPTRGREFTRAREEAERAFRNTHRTPEGQPRDFEPATASAGDVEDWISLYKRCFAQQVAVYPYFDGMEHWRPVVEERAKHLTSLQLDAPKAVKHAKGLSPRDRVDFIAAAHAENYVTSYVEVMNGAVDAEAQKRYQAKYEKEFSFKDATREEKRAYKRLVRTVAVEPAQPGVYQYKRVRPDVKNSWFWTRYYRTLEAFYPLEGHQAGFWPRLYRNVPGFYDFIVANERMVRTLVTTTTTVYAANWLYWGVAFPLPILALCLALRFTVDAPSQILTRGFRFHGLSPMGSVMQMILYGSIYAWATFWGAIPVMMFEPEMSQLLSTISPYVLPAAAAALGAAGCARLVAGEVKRRQDDRWIERVAAHIRAGGGRTEP